MRLRRGSSYRWKTADGRHLMPNEIEDDHLRNIIRKALGVGKQAPEPLVKEYVRRGLQPSFDDLKKTVKKRPSYEQLIEKIEKLEERVSFLEKMQEV
jgi:hypothetical protein